MASRATDIDKKFSTHVKNVREKLGISRIYVADNLGISHQQLDKNENGKNRFTPDRLVEIANILNVNFLEMIPNEYINFDKPEDFYNIIWNKLPFDEKKKLIKEVLK